MEVIMKLGLEQRVVAAAVVLSGLFSVKPIASAIEQLNAGEDGSQPRSSEVDTSISLGGTIFDDQSEGECPEGEDLVYMRPQLFGQGARAVSTRPTDPFERIKAATRETGPRGREPIIVKAGRLLEALLPDVTTCRLTP